jgi:D-alanyl-lipoteichoic acid acyltransferase DltB (MBOAT superfamily)
MLFPTIEFGLFFAFALIVVWSLNSLNLLKKWVLLGLSLAFYASWDWRFLLLLFASGAISYVVGLYVGSERPYRRAVLLLGVALDLGILCYFKYLDFFIAQLLTLGNQLGVNLPLGFVNVTLPVAISFLTFHAISYIVDVYRGRLKASRSPLDIVLYISFFPHLVAGPIVRAHEFLPQLASPRRAEDFGFGENLALILGGLLKKMVIANYLAVKFVDPVFTDPTQFSRFDLVMAVYAYAIQIYADFSAYTDIAIGVAALLGYRFPQNFNQPYRALGIGDFWRRWHMTLSAFLREYLYIPLGGNRRGNARRYFNMLITMLLGGLWHGANWTFVIWGGLHGIYLALNHALRSALGDRPNRFLQYAGWPVTFLAVVIAWVFFRAHSVSAATDILHAMVFGPFSFSTPNGIAMNRIMPMDACAAWLATSAGIAFFAPNAFEMIGWGLQHAREKRLGSTGGAAAMGALSILGLVIIAIGESRGRAQFLYFNF